MEEKTIGSPVKKVSMNIDDGGISDERKKRLKDWITFFRSHPWRFVETYFKLKLYPYQKFALYLMTHSEKFLALAARASAKSFISAVYLITRSVLYPGTDCIVSAPTRTQSALIIKEIEKLSNKYPNIKREIKQKGISITLNDASCYFRNGSTIVTVTSGDSGRGLRGQVLLIDERAIVTPETIITRILRPILSTRKVPYLEKKEYSHLVEPPQEINISSVRFSGEPWHVESMKFLKMIASGNESFKALFLDWTIAVFHDIKTKKQIQNEKETSDEISFSMEYQNLVGDGVSQKSFFKPDFFERNIKKPWRPFVVGMVGKNHYDIPRSDGEIRVLGIDISTRAGSRNDNSVIVCMRLFPQKNGYKTDVVFIKSMHGENSVIQALEIKRIWFQFAGEKDDVMVLDILNAGISVYDFLTEVTMDSELDKEYPAMSVMEHPEISESQYKDLYERTLSNDAVPCIFPISGTSELNSKIATALRSRLKNHLINFVVPENQLENFLIERKNKDFLERSEMRTYLLISSIESTLLINECVSLEMSYTGGGELLKLTERAGRRKDRFSALGYGNFYVSLLDNELLKEGDEKDSLSEWLNGTGFT